MYYTSSNYNYNNYYYYFHSWSSEDVVLMNVTNPFLRQTEHTLSHGVITFNQAHVYTLDVSTTLSACFGKLILHLSSFLSYDLTYENHTQDISSLLLVFRALWQSSFSKPDTTRLTPYVTATYMKVVALNCYVSTVMYEYIFSNKNLFDRLIVQSLNCI